MVTSLSVGLGFTGATGAYSFRGMYSLYGLRVAQMLPAFAASYVSAGGSRANLQLVLENWNIDSTGNPSNSSMVPYRWQGAMLSPTPATATASFSTTTMTISGVAGVIYPSWQISGSCVTGTPVVVRPLSANAGNGTYTISSSQAGSCSVTITNPVYSALSGPGGTASSTAYNSFPTRPIDLVDGLGYATYYQGALEGQGSASWSGTQSFYNTLFQASLDYSNGLTTQALNAWSADVVPAQRMVSRVIALSRHI